MNNRADDASTVDTLIRAALLAQEAGLILAEQPPTAINAYLTCDTRIGGIASLRPMAGVSLLQESTEYRLSGTYPTVVVIVLW